MRPFSTLSLLVAALTSTPARSYDLKQEISKSPVSRLPPDLARHPAAQSKMSNAMKRRAMELDD